MRECGMLLPVASLPSRYGIGAFSKEAYEFIDQLKRAGQQYWQILPLGPTGFGDSPYQSFSAFAGNPYFIDLEELIREELLTREECDMADFGHREDEIDYERLYHNRFPLLKSAYKRWRSKGHTAEESIETCGEETALFCLYMACKDHFHGASWNVWEEDIRFLVPEAVMRYQKELKEEIGFYGFLQMKFMEQWKRLKEYGASQGIRIIGDMPIYVAFDSADAWAHPELFLFDETRSPIAVAGCPPDQFAPMGQLWGNPLYRWGYHRETDYQWWKKRMEYSFELYDVVRVDHFRGFDEYYSIPAGDENAVNGTWEKGPGMELFCQLHKTFGNLDIIAEDLGFLTQSVRTLLEQTGFPGMKVLEFAFNSWEQSDYLPHNYTNNCVVYTGTHDNDTLKSWYYHLSDQDRSFSDRYLNVQNPPEGEVSWNYIRLALSSVARLAVIPVQDYLGLGSEARINEPSTMGKNWRWRLKPGALTESVLDRCRELASLYGRLR